MNNSCKFVFKKKRATKFATLSIVFGSLVGLSFKFSTWWVVVATLVAATLVLATLGDVLLTRCSGSGLRVNLLPTHLVGELAAELGGYGATQSAPSVGSVQHLGGCHV